uniref:Uncharacterized protein n=1 Tax=Onchocerca volvulus TaxID=6282 RepID=A0A8R1TYD3_ONCVO
MTTQLSVIVNRSVRKRNSLFSRSNKAHRTNEQKVMAFSLQQIYFEVGVSIGICDKNEGSKDRLCSKHIISLSSGNGMFL